MPEFIEQSSLYGCGNVSVIASVHAHGIDLNQTSSDHDHHMHIQINSLQGIQRLEAVLAQAKQRLLCQPTESDQTPRNTNTRLSKKKGTLKESYEYQRV